MKQHKGLKIFAICLAVLLVGSTAAFFIYTARYYPADIRAARGFEGVAVTQQEGYLLLAPRQGEPTTGLIFYPGAKVAEEAYLPYLAAIAAEGYVCAVVRAPFHLAILGPNRADRVVEAHPEITRWAVGGHSLGGVVAAGYAAGHSEVVQGLVLLAAYPNKDLSATDIAVLSITASNDTVLNQEKAAGAQGLLPPGARHTTIEGGNHAGFGAYGPQAGDGQADISSEEQNLQAAALTTALLAEIQAAGPEGPAAVLFYGAGSSMPMAASISASASTSA